jgi:chromosomal replication initiation ATPase DnaA
MTFIVTPGRRAVFEVVKEWAAEPKGVVLVVGAHGVGKTSLIKHFRQASMDRLPLADEPAVEEALRWARRGAACMTFTTPPQELLAMGAEVWVLPKPDPLEIKAFTYSLLKEFMGGEEPPTDLVDLLSSMTTYGEVEATVNQARRLVRIEKLTPAQAVLEATRARGLWRARPSQAAVVEAVTRRYGLSLRQIQSPCRQADVAFIRRILCYLLVHEAGASLGGAGRIVNRDHSTVSYALDRFEKHDLKHPNTQLELKELLAQIRGRGIK